MVSSEKLSERMALWDEIMNKSSPLITTTSTEKPTIPTTTVDSTSTEKPIIPTTTIGSTSTEKPIITTSTIGSGSSQMNPHGFIMIMLFTTVIAIYCQTMV